MAALYILLALPALVLARIDVQLSGGFKDPNDHDLGIYYGGSEVNIISDEEQRTFGLNEAKLKDSVAAYFGKRPDDVYLKSPTPWGDLYKSYGWDQVQRTLTPRSGKILEISAKPVIVLKQVFDNNSTKPTTFDVGISQSVQNTLRTSWSSKHDMKVGNEFYYDFKIDLIRTGGKTAFSFTSSYGRNTDKSETVTIGSTSGMQILLQPKQSVVAELHATRGTIRMEVEYEASLSGSSAVNYAKGYRGHHFWALDINGIMSSGGLENTKVSREIIDIGFYAESKVVVNDKTHGNKILEVNF